MKLLKSKQLLNAKILLFSGMLSFFIVGVASLCQAQKVPKEVQKIIDLYTKDSTIHFGFNYAKENSVLLDKTVKFSDITVGGPIEVYDFQYDSLEKYDDTVPIKSIISPNDVWYLPIFTHGKYLYDVVISSLTGSWSLGGMGGFVTFMFQKEENVKQHSLWGNPILIEATSRYYIHFPKKDAYNLRDAYPFHDDSLGLSSCQLKNAFNDSRKILRHHKELGIKSKPYREEFMKMRNERIEEIRKNNSGGGK